MIILDKELQERILNFNKYAQFISNEFGVSVVFDGTKAETDGKQITLPNIATMTPKEIDFLYCVLLHEVGHIKYSTFTTEAFSKVKTENHFAFVNAIEDARIENLLISDFDGANHIFEKLYNEYGTDKAFWKKVFGFTPDQFDDFRAFITYIHYKLLKIKNKLSFSEIMGEEVYSRVHEFVRGNNIDFILDTHPLKNWDDVISLANQLYDVFFSKSGDESAQNNIEKIASIVENTINDTLVSAAENHNKQTEKSQEIALEIRELRKDISKIWREKSPEIEAFTNKIDELQNSLYEVLDALHLQEKLQKSIEKIKTENERLDKKKDSIKKIEENIDLIQSKPTLTQKEEDKLNKLAAKLEKAEQSIDKIETKLEKNIQDSEDIKTLIKSLSEPVRNLSVDELQKLKEDLDSKIEKAQEDLEAVRWEMDEKIEQLQDLQSESKEMKKQYKEDITKMFQDLQEELEDVGIQIQILPSFEPTPGWEEADVVQQLFDDFATETTGEIVVNGAAVEYSNVRNILTVIEKINHDLKEIDPAKIFQERNGVSKLDALNDEEISQLTNTKDEQGESFSSTRRHVPLTTRYDVVKIKNTGSGQEVSDIRKKNPVILKSFKNLFKQKLKFQKKNRFRGNQEEGSLDQRSLWKLASRTDDNIYEISVPKYVNSVAASIAADISGSMDGDLSQNGKRIKELSVFISDALTECFIRHEICGYHAPVSHELRALEKNKAYNRVSNILETVVFKSFNDRNNNGIDNIEIQCSDNCDGENLRVIGNRLMKERSKRKILFIITDGKPFLSDADVGILDEDLRQAIIWLKRNKVEIFAFGFDEQARSFYGDNFCLVKEYKDVLDFLFQKL